MRLFVRTSLATLICQFPIVQNCPILKHPSRLLTAPFVLHAPQLIDKQKTPDYTITPIPSEPGFAIIRFVAGAPYEDIAFKVVDKPWEMGHKRGFRCHFSHNILQVWFHFRRERYRR